MNTTKQEQEDLQRVLAGQREREGMARELVGEIVEKSMDFQEGEGMPPEDQIPRPAPPPTGRGRPAKEELAQMERDDFGFQLSGQERQQLNKDRTSTVPKSMRDKGFTGTIQQAKAMRNQHREQMGEVRRGIFASRREEEL